MTAPWNRWKPGALLVALAGVPAIACSSAPTAVPVHAMRARASAATTLSAPVVTDHNDLYRSGEFVVPNLTLANARHLHLDPRFRGGVDGHVYAQPLYWRAASARDGQIVVATESNAVEALDATTGAVVWKRQLASPVPAAMLPCGNIAPVGITGTPTIDPATASVFVSANALVGGRVKALVYGLALATGRVLPGWPVDVGAGLASMGFSPQAQGQRGSLTLWNGVLYVPYGGRNGDCGSYHGTVVAVRTATPAIVAAWRTKALKGGIWAVGGAVVADDHLFVATGNTSGTTRWGGGEAIVRFDAHLKTSDSPADFFAPKNWLELDDEDLDIGGSNPMPLDVAHQHFIVALGKDGDAYVVDRERLGGVGGQRAQAHVSSSAIIGGPASWTSGSAGFVVFRADATAAKCASRQGLTVIRIGARATIATAWCAALDGDGSPIVTTTDGSSNRIVWIVGAEGDNLLHGFEAANGAVVFNGGGPSDAMRGVHHMSTMLAAQGHIYVPADGRIYAFTP